MNVKMIPSWYYRQFDADYSLAVPAEGYGGWKRQELPIDLSRTALVSMHAWDCGGYEQYPGWHRAVEYIPRANRIASDVFPLLFESVRKRGMRLFHVADNSGYADGFGGYAKTLEIYKKHFGADPVPAPKSPVHDTVYNELVRFRRENSMPGLHNEPDVERGRSAMTFLPEAMPLDNEPIASNSGHLHALCLEYGVNHLVYVGFAINWCLQYSPGNMNDMADRGLICSAIREAVTAVENRESARYETHKEHGLWVTALKNGFVYDLKDFLEILV
ncbi:MAG: hypothetical protein JXB33_01035 [Clostridia bacterium]|nr:hypothetical protein [Clostridia bacterium]